MWILMIFLLLHLIGLVLVGHLLLSQKSHASLILWTCWLILFPILGIPLYVTLGTEKIHKKRMDRFETLTFGESATPARDATPRLLQQLERVSRNELSLMTAPELMWGGDAFYERMVGDIDSAASFIHIQTYVWREDDEGQMVREALVKAAQRGVEVRILTDEYGSMNTEESFFQPILDAGGEFSWYSTVQTRRSRFFFNLRNHRKLTIIDGRIAYIGGMNVGKEYAGREIGPWTDLQMRFRGPLLLDLEDLFAEDWLFATRERLSDPRYYPEPDTSEAEIPVAILPSGPDTMELTYLKSFNLICNSAQKRLDLFTPYFVPNENVLITIETASARGVRVRLLIPTLNEHMYMVDIGRAYYEPLLKAGVEIYELPGRVHHSKAIRVDDGLIFAGSHNLDTRSFKLNFELSLCFEHVET
ncbi:MAG: phospholipase D-like domain-containing protein, partial [Kiritimatiellae bacterium]|nr:phospholipase D-like domain-containing protein [Kiritimatiellia bacterium]